ncbi:MAG: tetratricopeptide repeat protein [Oscillospiraceae bacterium]|jgi:tetratricopeptide (TPR) repeat protein|nr:tetratricopeptide repeat protein [Oscillospiraceae bacterium]
MKRFRASAFALIMLMVIMVAAASVQADGLTPEPVPAFASAADDGALRAKLKQAQTIRNPGACRALLLSILRDPDVSNELVDDAMEFAWDSDLIGIEDMVDLMIAVQALDRRELDGHTEGLTYMLAFANRADEAIAMLRSRITSDPDNAAAYEDEIINALLFSDRSAEAVVMLQEKIAAKTGNTDTYAKLADVFNLNGDYEEAIAAAEAGLLIDPENTWLLQSYAEALDYVHRYAEAVEALTKMLRIEQAGDEDVTYTYAMLYGEQQRAGQWKAAARSLEHAIGASQDASMFLERARFKLWDLYDPEAALKDLDALIKRNSGDVEARYQRVYAYLWMDRFDEARADAETLASREGGAASRLEAIAAYYAGRIEDAEALFAAVLEADPSDGVSWLFRAMAALYEADDPAAAGEYLDRAEEELGESDPDVNNLRGDMLQLAGQWSRAEQSYLDAADYALKDPAPLYNLGMLLCQQGRLDEARETLTRLEEEYPNRYWTLRLALAIEAASGDYGAALTTYDGIEAQFPFMAKRSLQYTRAALLAMDGQTGEASSLLAGLTPAKSMDYLAAAECYALLGDFAETTKWMDRASASIETGVMTPGALSEAEVTAALVSAETAYLQGDEAACLNYIREACELGWYPEAAKGNWVLKTLTNTQEYESLLAEYPVDR